MKKKRYKPETMTDIKVFLLFLLDRIGYPIDHTTLMQLVAENTGEILLTYDEALAELADGKQILADDVDGEGYYMISESGRAVSAELYDLLDEDFRERSLISAARYASLTNRGVYRSVVIEPTKSGMYKVTVSAKDKSEEYMSVSITVKSLGEAEQIKLNYDKKPDSVYRGILFSLTGRLEFLS